MVPPVEVETAKVVEFKIKDEPPKYEYEFKKQVLEVAPSIDENHNNKEEDVVLPPVEVGSSSCNIWSRVSQSHRILCQNFKIL